MPQIVTCPSCGKRNRVRPSASAIPRCGNCGSALPWLVDAGDETYAEEARAPVPVVVDLWAPWCAPCRMIAPVLERLAHEHAGRLKVVRVNVDEAPATAAEHQAMSIPTLVVLQDGRRVDRIVGALPERQLVDRIESHLAARPA
jgi:thioredoxin 2